MTVNTYNVRNEFLLKESISAIYHDRAWSTRCTSMLAQKITNHCSISSSGPREGERKTQAVIRGAFCVGLGSGRKGGRR